MKLAKLVTLLAVGLTLLGVIGCRKGPDKLTNIPNRRAEVGGDQPVNRDFADTNPLTPPDTTAVKPLETGYKASTNNFDIWTPDERTFRDQTVYFDFDKSNIKSSETGKLEEVARRMKSEFHGKALRVEGHCDERGTEEYNRSLGDRRALSVREYLVRLGLDPQMIPTISYGEDRPVDPGHNEAAWSKNRRGVLVLLSPPGSN
jgi:peptidoglycan-associated lipoprotein